jgi:hypothetical protein
MCKLISVHEIEISIAEGGWYWKITAAMMSDYLTNQVRSYKESLVQHHFINFTC